MTTNSNQQQTNGFLSVDDLRELKAPFPRDVLGVKVQSLNRERTRALLVLFLQHTDVQDRLEAIDPAWSFEVVSQERAGDTVYVRARLTLKGTTRENVGEGNDPKAALSDALKRCAMLFGVGRYLYDAPLTWVQYDENRDRWRQWTIGDYDGAQGGQRTASPAAAPAAKAAKPPVASPAPAEAPVAAKAAAPAGATVKPIGAKATAKGSAAKSAAPAAAAVAAEDDVASGRDAANRKLMALYRPYLAQFPDTRFVELLEKRYGVNETRMLSVPQLQDLAGFLESEVKKSIASAAPVASVAAKAAATAAAASPARAARRA